MSELELILKTPEPLTRETLAQRVSARGPNSGQTVVVHSLLSKLGWYEGVFEQNVEGLSSPIGLNCSANGPEQPVDCSQRDNANGFEFSASGTKTGLSGVYEGAEEDASVRIPFSGGCEMLKLASEPPPPTN